MIYIIGAGMGSERLLSQEAVEALSRCKNIIGPERIVKKYEKEKNTFIAYKPEQIKNIVGSLEGDTAVLMGGDTGFYSGAAKAVEALSGYDTVVIPGISSVSYFAARLKMPWEDWKLISAHGKEKNLTGWINEREKVFFLLNSGNDVNSLCKKLLMYKMDNVMLYVGENLSYDGERIFSGTPKELMNMEFSKLAVLLAVNPEAKSRSGQIKDNEFIRGSVPMTKAEIRTLSLAKLALSENSVLYDIGAGTGSVGINAAMINPDIRVYAIERNPEALELIEKNKMKFRADNVTSIQGIAPEALEKLEPCTHAFIGGSGGRLEDIVNAVFEKNPEAKIVINTVTVEALAEVSRIIKAYSLKSEIIMVSSSAGEETGGYTIMRANNSVYIITVSRGQV